MDNRLKMPAQKLKNLLGFIRQLFSQFNKRKVFRSVRWQLFFFIFIINCLFIPGGIASPNEGSRYLLTKTIVENDSFIWPVTWTNNQSGFWYFPDFGINQGFLSDKAPGLSFFLVPIYLVAKSVYTIFFGLNYGNENQFSFFDGFIIVFLEIFLTLLASITVVRLYDILNLLSPTKRRNCFISILLSFSTFYFTYTPSLFPAILTSFLYISILYHLIKFDRNSKTTDLIIAGLLAGFSIVVEYGSLLMLPWFFWYLISKDLLKKEFPIKKFFIFTIVSLLGVFPLLIYNFILSGNPLQTSYFFSHWISTIHFYNNLISGLALLLFDFNKGLFIFNPILILACIGFFEPKFLRKNFYEIFLIVIPVFVFIVFYAKNFDPSGGASTGPRYIIALIPLIIIGLEGWFSVKNNLTYIINVLFIAISIRNSLLSVITLGVNPGSLIDNPIFTIAFPRLNADRFNPILIHFNPFLFIFILGMIFFLFYKLNDQFVKEIFDFLFYKNDQISIDLFKERELPLGGPLSVNEIEFRWRYLVSTSWLLSGFITFFLFSGVNVLSRYYYNQTGFTASAGDYFFTSLLFLLSVILTLKQYQITIWKRIDQGFKF